MKKLFFLAAALVFSTGAMAQITISSMPLISAGKVDSCSLPTTTALAALTSLAPVVNGSWDLGSTAVQTSYFIYGFKAKTAGFPSATFSDSLTYGITTGIGYKCWRNVTQNATAVTIPGEEVTTRQAFGIGAMTGNNVDSFIIPTQAIVFSTPLPIMKFPATMGSRWTATTNRNVTFNLTVTMLGLNNAALLHKQTRLYLDSVVGWGQMKVPIVGKTASAWIPVLQVQHTEVSVDSFYLNGLPAPSQLLTTIGLAQGQSMTYPRTYFYRAGQFRPLVEAVHSGSSHTSSVSKLYMHMQELPDPTSVPSIAGTEAVIAYPNPARDLIYFNTPDTYEATIYAANGAVVLTRRVTGSLDVSAWPAGVYFLQLKDVRTGKQGVERLVKE